MGTFKPSQIEIKAAASSGKADEVRVIKIDKTDKPVVQDFEISKISSGRKNVYSAIKTKFSQKSVEDETADPVTAAARRKDSRFSLSPLLRDPLSIEEEERRVVEEKVRTRLAAVQDEARAHAKNLGYDAGLKDGYNEAFKKFQEEGAARLKRFEEFLESCDNAKKEIFRENERFLIDLVFHVARMVVLKELSTDKEYVLRLTKELIERVGIRDNVHIRIHPDDLTTGNMLRDGLEKAFGKMNNLNIEATDQVQRGGVMIDTEWNAIDASIETQLKGICEALTGGKA